MYNKISCSSRILAKVEKPKLIEAEYFAITPCWTSICICYSMMMAWAEP